MGSGATGFALRVDLDRGCVTVRWRPRAGRSSERFPVERAPSALGQRRPAWRKAPVRSLREARGSAMGLRDCDDIGPSVDDER